MMLRFQWDSLRRGDRILVHDRARSDLGLRPAEVVLVDTTGGRHDIGARLTDGDDAGRVVRPGRFAVHHDPVDSPADCWRCAEQSMAA